jgi:glycosyltransferase involved in cell wall biosynthesis
MKIGMLVYNKFTNDSRVLKEAMTLGVSGHRVTILALHGGSLPLTENHDTYRVVRVALDPWHLNVIRKLQKWRARSRLPKRGIVRRGLFIPRAIIKWAKLVLRALKFLKTPIYILLGYFLIEFLKKYSNSDFLKEFSTELELLVSILIVLRHKYLPNNSVTWLIGRIEEAGKNFHREFCYLSYYVKFIQFSKINRCDVYHAHDLNTLPVAFYCSWRDNAKLVYDSHEWYIGRNRLKPALKLWIILLMQIESIIVRRCDKVITVNNSIAKLFCSTYKIPLPTVVMNAPESQRASSSSALPEVSLRAELNIPDDRKILLYVGAITFNRGIEILLTALPQLPNCHLVCLGYGLQEYKHRLEEHARGQDVTDRFSFYGPVPTDKVVSVSQDADIGVAAITNCCVSYYLCSPNKLYEYMNAGLPVAVSNFPELSKLVGECQFGVTFDPGDVESIVLAINSLLSNPGQMEQMSTNALYHSTHHNWDNEASKLMALYEDLESV